MTPAFLHLPLILATEAVSQLKRPIRGRAPFLDSIRRSDSCLMIIGIGCVMAAVIATVGILSGVADQFHRRRMEAEMKRELLDRGLSATKLPRSSGRRLNRPWVDGSPLAENVIGIESAAAAAAAKIRRVDQNVTTYFTRYSCSPMPRHKRPIRGRTRSSDLMPEQAFCADDRRDRLRDGNPDRVAVGGAESRGQHSAPSDQHRVQAGDARSRHERRRDREGHRERTAAGGRYRPLVRPLGQGSSELELGREFWSPIRRWLQVRFMNEESSRQCACSACGSTSFEQGWVASAIHSRPITYRADSDRSFLGMGGQAVQVRRCTECGHLDLFVRNGS